MYQLSNSVSLGVSEQKIIEIVENAAAYCYKMEAKARMVLLNAKKDALQDEVYRAYGILAYAKQLTSDEFFNLVSVLKLGIALELIDLKDTVALDGLMDAVQPANLCSEAGRELSATERDKFRAVFVNERIKLLK
jgi:protein arginine kinase